MQDHTSTVVLAALTRIPLPPGPITLFKALYEATQPISRTELAAQIRDGDEKSLNGVFSALTNRVNGTNGLEGQRPGYQLLIERDETRNGVFFSMRPELRAAIDCLPDLKQVMVLSVSEIHSMFERESSWKIFQSRR